LVIGSELPPLRGVHNDVEAMTKLLAGLGFEVDARIQARASRDEILAGYRSLIDATGLGDTAVVYYSGHGGRAVNASPKPGERDRVQCIFPTDWTETGDFRAILDLELSALLAELTGKTDNVTVILDCCHAGETSRSGDPIDPDAPVPRVYGSEWARGVPEFLEKHKIDLTRVDVESNPKAVRVVASAADRRAFETRISVDGVEVRRGLFTSTLERVLRETGRAPLSWQTIVNRVRELVNRISPEQVPGVEGPADRLMFTTQVLKRPDAVVYFEDDEGRSLLRANRILGASVGAVYEIMPIGAVEHASDAVVARATVVELVDANARVELELVAMTKKPDPGALAFPKKLPYPPLPITVKPPVPDTLGDLLRNMRMQRCVDVVPESERPRFTIVADGASLLMREGERLAATPLADDDQGRELLMQRLERWAKAEAVRELVTSGLPHDAIKVGWGRVENGKQIAHGRGARMHLDERVYVSVTNQTDQPLYIAIFDIGIGGKATLLTAGAPNGRKLEPRASITLGQRDGESHVRGIGPMTWPADVPKDAERRESIVVIAASTWTDFTLLETRALPTRSHGPNRLEIILDSFRETATRDIPVDAPDLQGFCVCRIDFDLSPAPRPRGPDPG
jgi:hypothetical protein